MKKIILISFLFIASFVFAQEDQPDYNRWSIELAAGLHKPNEPATPGYFTSTPDLGNYQLGVRYMFNNKFGARLGFGYNRFENSSRSLPFKSEYMRATLEGVVNMGALLRFDSWTKSFGILAHTGVGYSRLTPKEPNDNKGTDQTLHAVIGLSPQVRLAKWLALTTDLSFYTHIRQHYNWDGITGNPNLGVGGNLATLSAGLTFYLGSKDQHADWVYMDALDSDILDDIESRLEKIETDMIDTDQDGVPDYLDREPNTVSGVAVDTKGRAVDLNENGIPDELEASLNRMYVAKGGDGVDGTGTGVGDASTIEHLLDNGYVNVYFQFNSDKPENYSLEAINYLVKYMKENPTSTADLVGYADELGSADYNQKLSERRAKRVYDILLATGVDASRLSYQGGGQDTSVDKGSSPARQLVRRVTFKLK